MKRLIAFLCVLELVLLFQPFRFSLSEGISMEPSLQEGNTLILMKTKNVDLGDIVVYEYTRPSTGEEILVAHRVQIIGKDFIVTKGDNNPVFDSPIPFDKIKYKVIGVIY